MEKIREVDIVEYYKKMENEFYNKFKINRKVLNFNVRENINEIIVHHYFISQMKRHYSLELEFTLREVELRTGLSFQKVRTAINKLEKLGILEIEKGWGRTPSIYKYIAD